MALPNYQVTVIDPRTGETIRIFDTTSFISLRYSRVLNDVGVLAIVFPGSRELYNAFPLDALIEVQREHPVTGQLEVEETYFRRLRQRFKEEQAEQVVIGGVSLNHLLLRRIVDPLFDPDEAGGYSTKAGASDVVIAEYVREQCADESTSPNTNRQFPGFTCPIPAGIGESAGARLRYEGLLESVQDLAKRGGVDFHISRTSGANMEMFIGTIGSDRTRTTNYLQGEWVGLNPLRGNLSSPSLVEDRKEERNFVYAVGQGAASRRKLVRAAVRSRRDSPFNRMEFLHDARNIDRQDALGLLTEAQAALQRQKPTLEFTFEPTGQEPGNIYRLDWDLGDTITAVWDDVEQDVRVVAVEMSIDASGETISVTLEPPDQEVTEEE